MASNKPTIRIGYVPEHYLAPFHLALRLPSTKDLPFDIQPIPFPSGTGHMITSLRGNEIDVGIGLTEGWVAGLTGKQQSLNDAGSVGGYKVVGQWVENPLRWAIVTGRDRRDINAVGDLKGGRVGVSRLGSGSHIMSFVLSQQQGWPKAPEPVVLGPFSALRDGVSGYSPEEPRRDSNKHAAEFFMWEHFTTKPYFHQSDLKPYPPLKKIGEIYTPWPSWLIAASSTTFPHPEKDDNLAALFDLLDQGIVEFGSRQDEVVDLLETGDLGCTYAEEDAREWMKSVKFVKHGTRGLDRRIVEVTVDVLKTAGVIPQELSEEDAVERVTGIRR